MSTPSPDKPAKPAESAAGPRLIRLGSAFGVPVFITPSWLLVVVFTTVSYAGFLKDQIAGASTAGSYALALIFSVALGASVLLHEFGHAAVSRLLGLPVRRIVVFLLGGVSEIEGEARRPRDEFAIAVAGPLVSFLLAAGCWLAGRLPGHESAAGVLLVLLAWSNLVIAIFNVLPGLPLDGGRLVQALIWSVTRSRLVGVRIAAWSGRVVAGLLALAILVGNATVGSRHGADLSTLVATVLGFAVAGFLWFGAGQTLRMAELGARTADLQLIRLIRPSIYLPASTSVSEAMRQAAAIRAAGIVVIDEAGRSRALVREAEVAGIELRRRPWVTIAEVSRSLEPGLIIAEDLPGQAVLDAVRTTPATEYLIIGRDGVSRGVLAISDLARALGLPYSTN